MNEKKPIPQVIAELQAMDVAALVVRYEELHGRPPRVKNRTWLWRRCAWKEQERRFGGLSTTAKARLEELIAELDLPIGEQQVVRGPAPSPKSGDIPVGTTLVRDWHGRQVRTTRVEGGWEHEGAVHRSLSAVAKAVTGAHWNGRRFFGLTKRGAAR